MKTYKQVIINEGRKAYINYMEFGKIEIHSTLLETLSYVYDKTEEVVILDIQIEASVLLDEFKKNNK